jgi:hypothetical protein
VNGVRSEKVIDLARQLREILDEVHREVHHFATGQGFTPDEAEAAFHELLAVLTPRRKAH